MPKNGGLCQAKTSVVKFFWGAKPLGPIQVYAYDNHIVFVSMHTVCVMVTLEHDSITQQCHASFIHFLVHVCSVSPLDPHTTSVCMPTMLVIFDPSRGVSLANRQYKHKQQWYD
jgi:hypothetical protein